MKKILLLFILLAMAGCGNDWAVGDNSGDIFNRRFSYYYVEECRYDINGPYSCSGAMSMGSSMKVSLRVEHDGFATLQVDGDVYYYQRMDYDSGYDYDYGEYYYQFYENDEELTVYEDGSQLIYVDYYAGTATYYYNYLPY